MNCSSQWVSGSGKWSAFCLGFKAEELALFLSPLRIGQSSSGWLSIQASLSFHHLCSSCFYLSIMFSSPFLAPVTSLDQSKCFILSSERGQTGFVFHLPYLPSSQASKLSCNFYPSPSFFFKFHTSKTHLLESIRFCFFLEL